MGPTDADQAPLYFISYVHDSGTDDEHVDQFYEDLDHDVRTYAGLRPNTPPLPRERAGFCDSSLRLGDEWSPGLIANLSTTRVFIAVMSPMYFASAGCGKEWTVFTGRQGRGSDARAALIPLLWLPNTVVPAIAQPYQYREAAFGAAYEKVRLRALIRERRHADDYKSFVQLLAGRVVEINKGSRVPVAHGRPAFDEVPAAFGDESKPAPPVVRPRDPHSPNGRPGTAGEPRSFDSMPILNTFRSEETP